MKNKCSFCSKKQTQVEFLIQGNVGFICPDCVDSAVTAKINIENKIKAEIKARFKEAEVSIVHALKEGGE